MRKMLLSVSALLLSGCIDYSQGERVGTLTKFSYKGLFCKTWEGQLLLGGVDDKGVPMTWGFTVENSEALVSTMKALSGKRVRITYNQEAFVSPCRSETRGYFAQKVESVQ